MNILIEIGHPGHVHLFRNAYHNLKSKGHKITVLTHDLPIAIKLLEYYNVGFRIIGQKRKSITGKLLFVLIHTLKLIVMIKKEKIDICISSSPSSVIATFISGKRTIFMDDDDDPVEPFVYKYVHPFCSVILSPQNTVRKSKKTIYYQGYHELAYLHPNVFIPEQEILTELGLKRSDTFFILRFVALKGHHDINAKGLSLEQKLELIKVLEKKGKVYITGERNLEEPLKSYGLNLPPEKLHHLLAFAQIFIGDSQTMASESAVLGVPSLRCNTFVGKITYLEDEEHNYGLTYGFSPDRFDDLNKKLIEILNNPSSVKDWHQKREKLLNDKIDVTAFMIWFIENYPESSKIMKENPEYQNRFK
ncbi:DUF354 domain-containing protein [Saccharicrinis sp. FJH62]|uniref:DUF354 domain-containing protein n=1 Tax=Saccharicrinis sp. FJH62 TaxID=3344657 RepID=UPI0035D462B8